MFFLYNAQEELKENVSTEHFRIMLSEVAKFLGYGRSGKEIRELKRQIKELKYIDITYNILGKDKIIEGIASAMDNIEFHKKKNNMGIEVRYTLPIRVKQAMIDKNGIFASIDLIVIKGLKSKYSIILYELIRDYRNVEIPKMTIREFRKIFDIETKYRTMAEIKRRVLKPACCEINDNKISPYEVNFEIILV